MKLMSHASQEGWITKMDNLHVSIAIYSPVPKCCIDSLALSDGKSLSRVDILLVAKQPLQVLSPSSYQCKAQG